MITWVQFLGGLPPLELGGGKNRPKFGAIFTQLHTTIANISGMEEAIDKRKTALLPALPPTCDGTNLVKFGPQTKKL